MSNHLPVELDEASLQTVSGGMFWDDKDRRSTNWEDRRSGKTKKDPRLVEELQHSLTSSAYG